MSNNVIVNNEKEFKGLTIDSRKVAEMIDTTHKNLLRKIYRYEEILLGSKMSTADFFVKTVYKDKNRRDRPCYNITKKGCDFIANKLTGDKGILFTAKYVDLFYLMKNKIAEEYKLPKTYKEALKSLVATIEEKEKIEKENIENKNILKIQAPQIELYNKFFMNDDIYSVNEVAKILSCGLGRNKLYDYLREHNILMKDKLESYQCYINKGYVEHRKVKYKCKKNKTTHYDIHMYFTPKGVEWIYNKLRRDGYIIKKNIDIIMKELKELKKENDNIE